jgi:hypothetical protein
MKPGQRVRLKSTGEVGIVVHTWLDKFLCATDCYVAFFGHAIPEGKPVAKPYILRYLDSSLELLD